MPFGDGGCKVRRRSSPARMEDVREGMKGWDTLGMARSGADSTGPQAGEPLRAPEWSELWRRMGLQGAGEPSGWLQTGLGKVPWSCWSHLCAVLCWECQELSPRAYSEQ